MPLPVRVLILDDSQSDAELMARELKRAGFAPEWRQAACKNEYIEALDAPYDIILADYALPDFDALAALQLLKERGLGTPFIVVTGSLGDEAAAECIKQGATDYLLKDRMKRLDSAVTRALEDMRKVEQQKITEENLRITRESAAESLRQANALLEQRVLERTQALTEANEQLRHETAERQKAEDALGQAQKMEAIGQLTGGIAHDFNNLLQVVLGNLDNLDRLLNKMDSGHASRALRCVEAAIAGIRRGEHLVKGLLAFGRRQPLAPRTFDVNELVGRMSVLLHRTLGETITIETRLAPNLWWAVADPHKLEGALLNLAINARDAMPNGGTLTISTDNKESDDPHAGGIGQHIQIAVTDTGCGMAPDILARAMDPFFTTKEVGQGSGLGLSQVYGYAKQSEGALDIKSEPGLGTTVTLFLPRSAECPIAVTMEEKTQPTPQTPDNVTVLVVEDEKVVQMVAVGTLEELGYRVLVADHAAAALEILQCPQPIDLLFSDVVMPGGMNGVELAIEAARIRPGIKVLLTSGYTRTALSAQHGVGTHLQVLEKPYRAVDLAEQLQTVLSIL